MLCLTSVWSNILSFNFALICLAPHEHEDGSQEHDVDKFANLKGAHFTPNQKTYLTSAVAISALFGNFIAVQLITKYGVRSVFTPLGLLSAISTALFPLALKSGFITTLILRCLQGIAFSANFPVIGAFTSKWAYYKQSGFVVSTLVAYVQLSPTLSDPISGALCDSDLGWESVFYGHALVCLFLFLLFGIIYRNSPG
uniref:Major facilitator superfamily (MFS) profile domain-containing protein n=1 Tax=Panagrolaimus sp. JU765 TaxID=591449 RepID=A0AC34RRW3_9BILA